RGGGPSSCPQKRPAGGGRHDPGGGQQCPGTRKRRRLGASAVALRSTSVRRWLRRVNTQSDRGFQLSPTPSFGRLDRDRRAATTPAAAARTSSPRTSPRGPSRGPVSSRVSAGRAGRPGTGSGRMACLGTSPRRTARRPRAAGRAGPPSAGSSSTAFSNGWRTAPSGMVWGGPRGRPNPAGAPPPVIGGGRRRVGAQVGAGDHLVAEQGHGLPVGHRFGRGQRDVGVGHGRGGPLLPERQG